VSSGWSVSTGVLGTLLLAAILISRARPLRDLDARQRRGLTWIAGVAIVLQATHFMEELSRGFDAAFPRLFGLDPLPRAGFVGFNVLWLLVWAMSAVLVVRGARGAAWPLWFLGLASVANGIAHPLMSVWTDGYFPGLVTSIPAGVAGAFLLLRLARLTGRSPIGTSEMPLGRRREEKLSDS
jgi:hypothetical protein